MYFTHSTESILGDEIKFNIGDLRTKANSKKIEVSVNGRTQTIRCLVLRGLVQTFGLKILS